MVNYKIVKVIVWEKIETQTIQTRPDGKIGCMEKDCYNNIVANNSSNNDVNDDSYDGGLFKDGIWLYRHIDRWFHNIQIYRFKSR